MHRTALLLAPLALALASCGSLPSINAPDISGTVRGTPPAGNFVVTLAEVNPDGTAVKGGRSFSLPRDHRYDTYFFEFYDPADTERAQDGVYELYCFGDVNGNGTFEADVERRTRPNGKLVVLDRDGQSTTFTGLRPGLNEVQGTQATQWGNIKGHDLSWQ